MALVAARTGWAPLGLVPHFDDARRLPPEDALALSRDTSRPKGARLRIAVPILPRIANFDDLDPLEAEPSVDLLRLRPGDVLPADTDLVILPGSKSTIADLAVLKTCGLATDILAHRRRGGAVLGLCGGYQMLGCSIADPAGVEGPPGTTDGLALLDVATTLTPDKRLAAVAGATADGRPFAGYEMHMGETDGPDRARPFAMLPDGPEGAVSADGRVFGTYVHGLFADDAQRAAWLARLGAPPSDLGYEAGFEAALDGLARHLEAHLDLDRLLSLAR
jgi:adenosylcobyric acid synthase